MERTRAFAPGNISGIFKVIHDPDPQKMHSLGLSFTVHQGVTAQVEEAAATQVYFNGAAVEFPTVHSLALSLASVPLRIELSSPLPISSGFGLSGASALATALAINALLGLGRDPRQLALAAHVAEVRHLTGLGDVCAQFHGGCLIKLRPGDPLGAQPLDVAEQPIYYRYFSPILTAEVLRDEERKRRINDAADQALAGVADLVGQKAIDFERCIRLARGFAQDSGLMADPQVRGLVEEIEADGGAASMIMLGNAVFSTRPFAGAHETALSHRGGHVLP
jgi:pantoate kinase